MNNLRQKLNSLGLEVPLILLPQNIDAKWPVIACDQFTQDRTYWEKLKTAVGDSPSTLNLIFPEVFLNDGDAAQRIAAIHSNMTSYLKNGIFDGAEGSIKDASRQGFIYIERDTPFNKKRRGLIAAIDLEQYDWQPDSRPLIRCTEGTVADRLPPRMDIRRGAPLELPHVLLLIDDDANKFLPALEEIAKKNAPVYDTPLMPDSGKITGWFLKEKEAIALITEKLEELYARSASRYSASAGAGAGADGKPFLFAVGDGNHSLAAAKGIWEEYKAANGCDTHPCRYALVEIENIYDPEIKFEPIHRVIFNADFDDTVSLLLKLPNASHSLIDSYEELVILCEQPDVASRFGVAAEGRYALIKTSATGIATACLQPLLDEYAKNKSLEIDYIHDIEEVFRLCEKGKKAAGILLPPVKKSGLFETVSRLGPLPRKSFSMGHSCEKRFYLECRALFG